MSRFEFEKEGKIVTYGYDTPLNEYFIEVRDPALDAGESEEENVLMRASSRGICAYDNVPRANSEMYEIMEKEGVSAKHLNNLILDMPF